MPCLAGSGGAALGLCRFRVALPHSAPGQGVSRPPHTASRDCRNGSPLARAIPCAPAVSINAFFTRCRRKRVAGLRRLRAEVVARPPASSGESPHAQTGRRRKNHWHPLPAYPHAAQRAVPGWRGGLGRVGADLASAGSMRPPPSPARNVSTARLATTHATRETAIKQPTPHATRETAARTQTTNATQATAAPAKSTTSNKVKLLILIAHN